MEQPSSTSDWILEAGWEGRARTKVLCAAGLALALSVQGGATRGLSVMRELPRKFVGYTCAAVLFSGVQELLRAARGRHDFINSALAGALAGGAVVGHYQGPKYRLLGTVTWGPICGVAHAANSFFRPRYALEDYLIREGLLSPHVRRFREVQEQPDPEERRRRMEQKMRMELIKDSMAVKDREIELLNARLVAEQQVRMRRREPQPKAGSGSSSRRAAGHADPGDDDVDGDDPAFQDWLRSSGMAAEALFEEEQQHLLQPAAAGAPAVAAPGAPKSSGAAGAGSPPRTWAAWATGWLRPVKAGHGS